FGFTGASPRAPRTSTGPSSCRYGPRCSGVIAASGSSCSAAASSSTRLTVTVSAGSSSTAAGAASSVSEISASVPSALS
ncbi:hypothetical protein ACC848_44260, partial [Rhizobium johnstonii]